MMKHIYILLLTTLLSLTSTYGGIKAINFEDHLNNSDIIVVGVFSENELGQLNLVIEEVLKGELDVEQNLITDESSRLGWQFAKGGGYILPTNNVDFLRRVKLTNWYNKRAVICGRVVNDRWVSFNNDFSVWISGNSTREEIHEELNLDDLIIEVRKQIEDIEDDG